MQKDLISQEGYTKLQNELKQLIKIDRPAIIKAIDEARSHGDLKENAEYHAAREKQGFIEGRIERINYLLANLEMVDLTKLETPTAVHFGTTVTYINEDTEEEVTWQILGEEETDIKNRKISIKSPIALSLLGKEVGDTVTLALPKGNVDVEITAIS